MKIYFSSDCHFQHANIILYAHRNRWIKEGDLNEKGKWISKDIADQRVSKMDSDLIKSFNHKTKEDDIIYHVGDFIFKGGKESNGKQKSQVYENKINAKVIHILGNHDRNNSVKGGLEDGIIKFANKFFYLVHRPPQVIDDIPKNVDAVLCGHVHDAWKYKFIEGIPIINVGVDVWNYNLVSTQQVAVFYDKIMKERFSSNIENMKKRKTYMASE
jgi:calcineurin-like phosphoesterase family protein